MKIKKKKATNKKSLARKQSDRKNFFIVISVILLVNILLFFTALPKLDGIAATGSSPEAAAGIASFLKVIVIVVTDILLFVPLSMILSRRSAKHIK